MTYKTCRSRKQALFMAVMEYKRGKTWVWKPGSKHIWVYENVDGAFLKVKKISW
jgi:hypothetical protein